MAKYISESTMKPETKAKWVEALRSGEYKQARETLERREDDKILGYCCLGVLCKISKGKYFKQNEDFSFGECEADTELSWAMREKVGLSEDDQRKLIQLNDGNSENRTKPVTFKKIATWIEKNVGVKESKKKKAA